MLVYVLAFASVSVSASVHVEAVLDAEPVAVVLDAEASLVPAVVAAHAAPDVPAAVNKLAAACY
jgi:hypothetical protein